MRKLAGPAALAILGTTSLAAAYVSPDLIRRVVREHLGEIRGCYEEGLARRPDLAGRVTVRWVIGADGHVTGATITQSTLGDSAVEQCIATKITSWTFPLSGTGAITVTYPFALGTGS